MWTPTTSQERALLKAELKAMLDAIGEEMEVLKPLLRRPEPPQFAIVLNRRLARMARETREVLFAMRAAEIATVH